MGDSPPPGYNGGSVLQTPANEIPMMRVQGGGGSTDVFGQVPQIPIQRMVGGNGEDDIVTEAVIAHIIATVLSIEEEKHNDKKTKLLWNYNGKNRIRVRTNLTDSEIEDFLTLKPEAFQLDERALFNSLFFSERDVLQYLVEHSEGFVRFWKRFIEHDGTNPVILYTTKEGKFYQDFLKNIASVRLNKLLGNVAYLLPVHKRTADVDPENLVLNTQPTAKTPVDFLPTEIEKTKFTQEKFDELINPIEKKLVFLKDNLLTDSTTIDGVNTVNKVREFVKVYKEVINDIIMLKTNKSDLEKFQQEDEPKLKGIIIVIQKLRIDSAQDRVYIDQLNKQKEALEQINRAYNLYISKIDKLVLEAEGIVNLKKILFNKLTSKMNRIFKVRSARTTPPSDDVLDPASDTPPPAAPRAAEVRTAEAIKKNKDAILLDLKEKVSKSANAGEIITKVLTPFFVDGKSWPTVRGTYGENGYFSNFLWKNRQTIITNPTNQIKYTVTRKDKTTFQSLKEDKQEADLWKYLDKLLFLEEYTPQEIEEIKKLLNTFIVTKVDYLKMADLYKHVYYVKQKGGNLPGVPKRVTLRKSKTQTQA